MVTTKVLGLIKKSLLTIILLNSALYAQSIFDGPDCVNCIDHFPHFGNESIPISETFAESICQSYLLNDGVKSIEVFGTMHFGSKKAYYENLYRVPCEMDNQSPPLFIGIERNPGSRHLKEEVFKTLSRIDPMASELLLNRPRKNTSQSRETILDMIIRQQRGATRGNQYRVLEVLKIYEKEVINLGGKRYRDLSDHEIRRYNMEPLSTNR